MHSAVSGALVVKKKIIKDHKAAKQQFPVYFMSEVLTGSKKYYSEMEKIYYAIIMSARKLWHYFEARTIKVLTNDPLNDIFGNRDTPKESANGQWSYQNISSTLKTKHNKVTNLS
jgi:hypothetical protein